MTAAPDFPIPRREADLVAALLTGMPSRWRGCWVATEVPTHGKARADIILMTPRQTVAIEVKRTAWQRALGQALLNRYIADRSYVALWAGVVSDRVVRDAASLGLGVIAIEPGRSTVVQSAARVYPDPELRGRVRQAVRDLVGVP
jgi:hypothetical protein